MSDLGKKPLEKKNFGQLAEFDELIVFAMKDGGGGLFVSGNAHNMRHMIATVLRQKPELRDFLLQCIDESMDIFTMPKPEIIIAK